MRLLFADDDPGLCTAVATRALFWKASVMVAKRPSIEVTEVATAMSPCKGIKLLGTSFDILIANTRFKELIARALYLDAPPIVIAISDIAEPEEAFRLALQGARAYLKKPFELAQLRATVLNALSAVPDITSSAKAQVGHQPIHAVQDYVKVTMLRTALVLENGNLSRTARRLGVTRAAVQQMLDRFEIPRGWPVGRRRVADDSSRLHGPESR